MSEPESKKRGFLSKIFRSKDHVDRGKNGDKQKGENDPPQLPVQAPIDYHSYGLKCVAKGTNPTVDIVAVHGLNGHRENTWKAENGVNWLADENMLPKRIPNARIFVWGYDARTHGHDYLTQAYLHQHGTQLVGDLADERRLDGTSKRPIIFIGHSLGGIVIKSALIHSNATHDEHLAHHRPIKVSTYGILFMGTPHSGGQGVTMGQIAQSVASIFVHTNDNVLQHLQQQSEWLTKQKDDYASIMKDFVTKFGWEVFETPIFGGLKSILVVPQWSAIGWQGNAEPVQIMANHITMVKFRGEEDPEYNKVWKKLAIMAQEAEEKIVRNWRVEEGRQAVADAILNKHNSEAMLIEVIARLTERPADGALNKPDDENYLTIGASDVLYDPDNDIYEAKSVNTLVETVCIEETDRMRKYEDELIQAIEQYEKTIGSKDIKLSTGISLTSQHNWNDVVGEAEVVRERYRSQDGSNSISTLENGLRTYESAPLKVEQWLALLPSAKPYASRLCGALRIVFAIIWRSGSLSDEAHNALNEIPATIADSQDIINKYDQPTIAERVEQLYCAVISTLRHILSEYCRDSTHGPHVHFSHGFELMHRYKKSIEPEQQLIINQRVRVEALNSLKAIRNKLWVRIFAVLNEQLTKTHDDQELDDVYDDMKKSRETSVNAGLYEALEYDHFVSHVDMRVTMRQGFHFSVAEKSRTSWLIDNESLRDWIISPTSDLFLINGNEARHEFTSPVSVYCAMLTRALQSQPPRVVLYWYCGLHVRESVAGVLRNLIGQLLRHIETDKFLESDQKVWYAGLLPNDPESLFRLFKTILKHQLKSVSVFCILDGISFYEGGYRGKEMEGLIVALEILIIEAEESNGIFKVLLTSPTRSRIIKEENKTELVSVEVLHMPRFIMMDRRSNRDFEVLRELSRRSSISSFGSAVSVYHDVSEYIS